MAVTQSLMLTSLAFYGAACTKGRTLQQVQATDLSAADSSCSDASGVIDSLMQAGSSFASAICADNDMSEGRPNYALAAEMQGAISETIAYAVAGCISIDTQSGSEAEELAGVLAEGFAAQEDCSCEGGGDVLAVQATPLISNAWAAVSQSAAPSVTALVSKARKALSGTLSNVITAMSTYAADNCMPAFSVDIPGVVSDQSAAQVCGLLTEGGATVAETYAAAEAMAGAVCDATWQDRERNSMMAPYADSLATAITGTLLDAEAACSTSNSEATAPQAEGTFCTLTNSDVVNVVRAQMRGFAEALVNRTQGCDCAISAVPVEREVTRRLVFRSTDAYMTLCMNGPSYSLEELALPIGQTAGNTLQRLVRQSCNASGTHTAYGWSQCGGNDYAKNSALGISPMTAHAVSTACCPGGWACMVKNMWYAQCRPAERDAPTGWNGTLLTDMQQCM